MIFVLLILIIIGLIMLVKWILNNTESDPEPVNRVPSQEKQATPVKPFDETNPMEIIHLTYALSTVVACMRRSRMYVVLQSENPDKGWPQKIVINASIYDFDRDFPDHSFHHFIRWGLSEADAQYLASVPFDIRGRDVTYTFKSTLPTIPLSLKSDVEEAMERGINRSALINRTDLSYEIDTSCEASVACTIGR